MSPVFVIHVYKCTWMYVCLRMYMPLVCVLELLPWLPSFPDTLCSPCSLHAGVQWARTKDAAWRAFELVAHIKLMEGVGAEQARLAGDLLRVANDSWAQFLSLSGFEGGRRSTEPRNAAASKAATAALASFRKTLKLIVTPSNAVLEDQQTGENYVGLHLFFTVAVEDGEGVGLH